MTGQTIKSALISLAVGFLGQLFQGWLGSTFLTKFLAANLITLLVALLAINSATMGIVLTKIRDLVDSNGGGNCFRATRDQMIHSVKEQIALIVLSVLTLVIADSKIVINIPDFPLLLQSCINGIFVYSLLVLYDTGKGVLLIVDFDPNHKAE